MTFVFLSEISMYIQRTNRYLSISNNHFSIIDIVNFLTPGTPYSKFLTSLGIEEKKFFFPYQKLSSFEALEGPLPPYDDPSWFSDIRGAHLLNCDFESWQANGSRGEPPPTGLQNYEMIQRVWEENGFENLMDHLIYYNELDTRPFVPAISRFIASYHTLQLDALKISSET